MPGPSHALAPRRRCPHDSNSLAAECDCPFPTEAGHYLAFPIILSGSACIGRQALCERLEDMGVETRALFGCIPLHQRSYRHLAARYEGRLPAAEHAGRQGFYIGCHQYLTDEDVALVSRAFHKAMSDA